MVDTRILLASLATVLLAASVLATPGRAEQVSNGGAEVPARKLPVPETVSPQSGRISTDACFMSVSN